MKRPSLFLFFLIALGVLFLDRLNILTPLYVLTDPVIIPMKRRVFESFTFLQNIPLVFSQYEHIEDVTKRLHGLTQEIEELKLENTTLKTENEKMRKLLGAPLPSSFQFIPARVVARAKTMEIAVGAREGVRTGMAVVDGKTILGVVAVVSQKRSSVKLLTDETLTLSATTSRGSQGIVHGGANGVLLDNVLQKDVLLLDDHVITAGDEEIPSDLLIGRISYITDADVAVYKQAKIEPAADPAALDEVFVISDF